jgi:hypothetical protein
LILNNIGIIYRDMSKKLLKLSLLTFVTLTLSYCTGNKEQPPAEEAPAATESAPAEGTPAQGTEAPPAESTEQPSH